MKVIFLPPIIILVVVGVIVQVVHTEAETEDDPEKPDIKALFEKFFKNKNSNVFKDFLRESGKKMGIKAPPDSDEGEDKKDDKKDDKKGDKKGDKKSDETPLPGKVFVFYGKTYGCAKSKVYQEFIKNYKDGTLPTPKLDEDASVEDKWLKQLAKKEIDVDDASKKSVSLVEAEEKVKKLDKAQLAVLTDGESQMPPDAQIFLHFVRAIGCEDSKVADYKKFNDLLKEEITKAEKKKGKKATLTYYIAKSDTIIVDELQQQ